MNTHTEYTTVYFTYPIKHSADVFDFARRVQGHIDDITVVYGDYGYLDTEMLYYPSLVKLINDKLIEDNIAPTFPEWHDVLREHRRYIFEILVDSYNYMMNDHLLDDCEWEALKILLNDLEIINLDTEK